MFDARSSRTHPIHTLVMTNFDLKQRAASSSVTVRLPSFDFEGRQPMEKECWNAAQITLPGSILSSSMTFDAIHLAILECPEDDYLP